MPIIGRGVSFSNLKASFELTLLKKWEFPIVGNWTNYIGRCSKAFDAVTIEQISF